MMRTPLSVLLKEKGSDVYNIPPSTTGFECARTLNDKHIGALLVMEKDKILGIISERDLIRKLVCLQGDPQKVPVSQLMTANPLTVLPTTTVQEAMKIITEKRFRHLPVVEDGKLLGIISIGDLTRWVMEQQQYEISQLTGYIQGTS